MEKIRSLVDRANIVSYFGGDPSSIMNKIDEIIKGMERDERMRSYWEKAGQGLTLTPAGYRAGIPFCVLTKQRVMGIVASLNEISQIFMAISTVDQGVSLEKFLNCKSDIHTILALGTIQAKGMHR